MPKNKPGVRVIDVHEPRQQHLLDRIWDLIEEHDDGEVLTGIEIVGVLDVVKFQYIFNEVIEVSEDE